MAVQWEQIAFANKTASKTTAAWSKSIGSGGDYATWAAMIADMPDLIAHAVTVTIKAGTTLTETCDLKNKHGLTSAAAITIQAEKYFPTSGVIPTADSATATTLRDAALATAALGNDYFNGCWVFIVDGTGTDNGFVPVTDYVDATGDVVVASWPGTQPDNTSRYLIVGTIIDSSADKGIFLVNNTAAVYLYGIGIKDSTPNAASIDSLQNMKINIYYCGIYNASHIGIRAIEGLYMFVRYSGIVKCNTGNDSFCGGLVNSSQSILRISDSGISDNLHQGILSMMGGFTRNVALFGDANGTWGSYAKFGGNIYNQGTECSGSSGNHSDPGTAGTANADQASAY